MRIAFVLVLSLAGVANAQQGGNVGPPVRVTQVTPQTAHTGSSHRSHDSGRRRHWNQERERSSWGVGFQFEYREGGWGNSPPPCNPLPCPPPVCNDTRTERVVVPGYWVVEPVLDHCGRQLYDWRGCPVTRQVFISGYTELVTYRRDRYQYWDGCCWNWAERWVECGRERVIC